MFVFDWNLLIAEAIETPDPVIANYRITRAHYLLSESLREAVGLDGGSNFHSWAVWGSRKAGVTIRQEDKDQASRDATLIAGIVGGLVGLGVGWLMASFLEWSFLPTVLFWIILGIACGGYCGFLLANYTRRAASRVIFEGNCIVLDDIGRQTGQYLEYAKRVAVDSAERETEFLKFLTLFRTGTTEQGGQDFLRRTFELYEAARLTCEIKEKHEACYFANCLAVLHEHIRLQPYISRSLPFLIRKCVTQRLMTYSIGEQLLAVHEDVPALDETMFPPTLEDIASNNLNEFLAEWDSGRGTLKYTRAKDWTKIRERMGYIVNLFRTRHLEASVVAAPYTTAELEQIGSGKCPVS